MYPTQCARLRSCSPSIVSTSASFKTSKTQGWTLRHQYRCRRSRSWCMWVQTHTHIQWLSNSVQTVFLWCSPCDWFLCQGRELLACAPTGSGKTLAFCLPLLAHLQQPANLGFRAVIISPTRELASQVHDTHTHTHTGLFAIMAIFISSWGEVFLLKGLG